MTHPNAIVATEEIRGALADRPTGATIGQVAADLCVSTSTVRRHLDALMGRGWVERHYGRPTGRLCLVYHLTLEGRAAEEENRGF